MLANHVEIEKRLWESADQLRANSRLKSSEYSGPVLGLIFLRFADHRFSVVQQELEASARREDVRRTIGKADYQARGVLYIPEQARFSSLLRLPEGENIGRAINDAMRAIETENEELRGVLPKDYNRLENDTLISLLKIFSEIPVDFEGIWRGKLIPELMQDFERLKK